MKTITPVGEIIQSNSTHVAIKTPTQIEVYSLGFVIDEGEKDEYRCNPECLYIMAIDEEDNLFEIFEQFDEANRINLAEANGEV